MYRMRSLPHKGSVLGGKGFFPIILVATHLHSGESHYHRIDCTQNPLRVKGLGDAVKLLQDRRKNRLDNQQAKPPATRTRQTLAHRACRGLTGTGPQTNTPINAHNMTFHATPYSTKTKTTSIMFSIPEQDFNDWDSKQKQQTLFKDRFIIQPKQWSGSYFKFLFYVSVKPRAKDKC